MYGVSMEYVRSRHGDRKCEKLKIKGMRKSAEKSGREKMSWIACPTLFS
jgi:hypothetical protein